MITFLVFGGMAIYIFLGFHILVWVQSRYGVKTFPALITTMLLIFGAPIVFHIIALFFPK